MQHGAQPVPHQGASVGGDPSLRTGPPREPAEGSSCGTFPSRQVCGVDLSAAEFGDRCIALVPDDADAGYGSDDVVVMVRVR